jgi:hypothetical protein
MLLQRGTNDQHRQVQVQRQAEPAKKPEFQAAALGALVSAEPPAHVQAGRLTADEAAMIFESMPELSGRGYTSEGHWFCCPNGHVYTVGECGGAMETSQCPECGAVIGGSSHQLDSSNGIASSFLDLANAEIDDSGYW